MVRSSMMLATLALAMTACGPGAKVGGGKQGAAQALYAASSPTSAGADRAATPIDLTGSITWNCPEGGSAELSNFKVAVNTGTQGRDVSQSFTLVYKACGLAKSEAGVAIYNGSFEVAQRVETSTSGVIVEQSFKGHLTINGAFEDFLDADVTQRVAVSEMARSGASVSMKLTGTLANASGNYSFAEDVSVIAGTLTVEASKG